jgi:hypothetical protein
VNWFRIRSWHYLRWTDDDLFVALCGKRALKPLRDVELPAEKSCESCLRILARARARGVA